MTSTSIDTALRDGLLAMRAEDERVRTALAATGELFQGYAPAMQAVHDRHAALLASLVERQGWPGASRVGEDGAEAAWLILQHAIAQPALLRRCLPLLQEAAAQREVPPWQPAFLEDRIRVFEGRPQRYGTQFDWDANGELNPLPLEDPEGVEARRRALGLCPLAEWQAQLRSSSEPSPTDPVARLRAAADWARSVGWRD